MADTSNCETPYCRNKTTSGRKHCSTCRSRKSKRNNPFKYYYQNLRDRAKSRGKDFNLALEQFMLLWLCEPEKWENKIGSDECKYHIHRIKNHIGYEFDNIELVSRTRHHQLHYNENTRKVEVEVYYTDTKVESELSEKAPF